MFKYSKEFKQKFGFGGWDDPRPQSECLMCHGTGQASGDPQDPNQCGFCYTDNKENKND